MDFVFSTAGALATVSGLDDLYTIAWDTSAVHDQVLIEGVAGKFDIGAFAISQPQPTPDEKLDFTVQIADFDGEPATRFSIGIDGTGDNDNDIVNPIPGAASLPEECPGSTSRHPPPRPSGNPAG